MNLPEQLILKQMEIGPLNNFLYFVGDVSTGHISVVDPAWDVNFLFKEIEKFGYKVQSVWLTHGHPDHVNGLSAFLARYDVPAYISRHEATFLKPKHKNIVENEDRQELKVGGLTFQAILTPGHTPGCQSFRYQNVALTGDAIFIDGCGRCDLPGGDPQVQYQTLYQVISGWPDDTLLFTGHNYGPKNVDTLGNQKRTNPYLTCPNENEFLRSRMGL